MPGEGLRGVEAPPPTVPAAPYLRVSGLLPRLEICHNLRDEVVIVREYNVYAHFEEVSRLNGVIRPENVAYDAVGVRFVYHSLVELRLHKLYLLIQAIRGLRHRQHWVTGVCDGMPESVPFAS